MVAPMLDASEVLAVRMLKLSALERPCSAVCSADRLPFSVPYAVMRALSTDSCLSSCVSGCCSTDISFCTMPLTSRPEPMPGEERVGVVATGPTFRSLRSGLVADEHGLHALERLRDLEHLR